jgi:hypothetical protein
MVDESDLLGLLRAFAGGDLVARRALRDVLEEAGDARAEALQQEGVDWDDLATQLSRRLAGSPRWYRWLIDCARFGSPTQPEVAAAVRQARRGWLQELFPELDLD